MDVGIPVVLSYEYRRMVFDVRYLFGLPNVNKEDIGGHLRNSAFAVTLGV